MRVLRVRNECLCASWIDVNNSHVIFASHDSPKWVAYSVTEPFVSVDFSERCPLIYWSLRIGIPEVCFLIPAADWRREFPKVFVISGSILHVSV